jgi:hypothetical protein
VILGNHAVIAALHVVKLRLTVAGIGTIVVVLVVVVVDSTTVVVGVSRSQSAGVLILTMPMSARGKTAKTDVRCSDERIDKTVRTPIRRKNSAGATSARSLPVPGRSQTTFLFTDTSSSQWNKCN